MTNSFRSRLINGEKLIGTMVTLSSAAIAEVLANAVEDIDAITQVEGIDAVFLGPYDLSASLGKTGLIDDPSVTQAIDRVTKACQSAGIPLGLFGVSAAAVQPFIDTGYTLITVSTDTLLLGAAARGLLAELRLFRKDATETETERT